MIIGKKDTLNKLKLSWSPVKHRIRRSGKQVRGNFMNVKNFFLSPPLPSQESNSKYISHASFEASNLDGKFILAKVKIDDNVPILY